MFHVYVLKSSARKYFYVGLTADLDRRLAEHKLGKSKTTAPYRPFTLLFSEVFQTRLAARRREKYLKSGVGKEYIKRYAQVAKLVDALP